MHMFVIVQYIKKLIKGSSSLPESYGRKCLKRLRLYGKDARNRGYLAVLFGWVRFSIKKKDF